MSSEGGGTLWQYVQFAEKALNPACKSAILILGQKEPGNQIFRP